MPGDPRRGAKRACILIAMPARASSERATLRTGTFTPRQVSVNEAVDFFLQLRDAHIDRVHRLDRWLQAHRGRHLCADVAQPITELAGGVADVSG